MPEALHAAGLS